MEPSDGGPARADKSRGAVGSGLSLLQATRPATWCRGCAPAYAPRSSLIRDDLGVILRHTQDVASEAAPGGVSPSCEQTC
ncbi:hypothetical protein VT52_034500 [Streptomyces malaysiense]|uniref:Uncharacterized protein n=1 Tax=Streptomyces malaysiense TaxID=1428626 RepID=A0A1J4PQ89_9ACTN|nr:hypothetical protein VT52_034500 [Streptomyces malaysiense]